MKTKKIRGYNRVLQNIEYWKIENEILDLENLFSQHRDYAKIWVEPYSTISLLNSKYPEPKGKIRAKILRGLLDIYTSWKTALDTLNQEYYLKIWLYDMRFSKSQVVCAIGPFLDFYDSTFYKPEKQREINLDSFGIHKKRMENLNWEYAFDEEHYNNTSIGEIEDYESDKDFYDTRRWFKNRLKKPHRKLIEDNPNSEIKEYYSFKQGGIWIGGE